MQPPESISRTVESYESKVQTASVMRSISSTLIHMDGLVHTAIYCSLQLISISISTWIVKTNSRQVAIDSSAWNQRSALYSKQLKPLLSLKSNLRLAVGTFSHHSLRRSILIRIHNCSRRIVTDGQNIRDPSSLLCKVTAEDSDFFNQLFFSFSTSTASKSFQGLCFCLFPIASHIGAHIFFCFESSS